MQEKPTSTKAGIAGSVHAIKVSLGSLVNLPLMTSSFLREMVTAYMLYCVLGLKLTSFTDVVSVSIWLNFLIFLVWLSRGPISR